MPTNFSKALTPLADRLLVALLISVSICAIILAQVPDVQQLIGAIVGAAAIYSIFILPGVVMIVTVLLLVALFAIPVCLLLFWLVRRGYRTYTARRAHQPLPASPAPLQEMLIPWTQRQFKH